MDIHTQFILNKNLRIHKVTGPFDVDEFNSFVDELIQMPEYQPGLHALWDLTDSSFSHMSNSDVSRLVQINNEKAQYPADTRLAFVCKTDLDFGIFRQFESHRQLMAKEVLSIRIFRDLKEAQQWICSWAPLHKDLAKGHVWRFTCFSNKNSLNWAIIR